MKVKDITQKEKELLLKDLCGRLAYGVKITTTNRAVELGILTGVSIKGKISVETKDADIVFECTEVKPYLRPMSSMTKEEEDEWCGFNVDPLLEAVGERHTRVEDLMLRAKSQYKPTEWLNEHHFDYRGLIPKGLAIEAPDGMYK